MTGFLPGILKITLFADLLIGLVWLLSVFYGAGQDIGGESLSG